jgi:hypothetical protein
MMDKKTVFEELKIANLNSPKDLYLFLDQMTSSNSPEIRRAVTFRLSVLMRNVRRTNSWLYSILVELLLYEITNGAGITDSWLQRNILEVFLSSGDNNVFYRLCEIAQKGYLNDYNLNRLARLGIECS